MQPGCHRCKRKPKPLSHAAEEMAKYYDQHHQSAPEFQEGEKVWLSTWNYAMDCPTKKLDHQWIGPFVILKVISHAAVKLKLMAKERGVHPVISVSNIYHYTPEEVPEHPADPCPGSDVIDGEEEYKVEKILDSKYW